MNANCSKAITVTELNVRLNRVYDVLRKQEKGSQLPKFAELWDLKEMALIKSHAEVLIPEHWLRDLEESTSQNGRESQ